MQITREEIITLSLMKDKRIAILEDMVDKLTEEKEELVKQLETNVKVAKQVEEEIEKIKEDIKETRPEVTEGVVGSI